MNALPFTGTPALRDADEREEGRLDGLGPVSGHHRLTHGKRTMPPDREGAAQSSVSKAWIASR
jgi:hypothetical protein